MRLSLNYKIHLFQYGKGRIRWQGNPNENKYKILELTYTTLHLQGVRQLLYVWWLKMFLTWFSWGPASPAGPCCTCQTCPASQGTAQQVYLIFTSKTVSHYFYLRCVPTQFMITAQYQALWGNGNRNQAHTLSKKQDTVHYVVANVLWGFLKKHFLSSTDPFNWVSGSGLGIRIRIPTQAGQNGSQKREKIRNYV